MYAWSHHERYLIPIGALVIVIIIIVWILATIIRNSSRIRRSYRSFLRSEMSKSIARCVERLIAAGVEEQQAMLMIDESTIGSFPRSICPTLNENFVILVGDIGSGKSLGIEREYQREIGVALRKRRAPALIYLGGGDLDEKTHLEVVVQDFVKMHGLVSRRCLIFVDGLDEAPTQAQSAVAADARVVTRARPDLCVFMTSRSIPGDLTDEGVHSSERRAMPVLSQDDALALMNRVASLRLTNDDIRFWPEAILETVKRPLFAILVAIFMSDEKRLTASEPELVGHVVRRVIGPPADTPEDDALKRLATACTRAGAGSASESDAGIKGIRDVLRGSRLVLHRDGKFGFPLQILATWFAARSLVEHDVVVSDICSSPRLSENWEAALRQSMAPEYREVSNALLRDLVKAAPGLAAAVVEASVPISASDDSDAGPEPLASEMQECANTWLESIPAMRGVAGPEKWQPNWFRPSNHPLVAWARSRELIAAHVGEALMRHTLHDPAHLRVGGSLAKEVVWLGGLILLHPEFFFDRNGNRTFPPIGDVQAGYAQVPRSEWSKHTLGRRVALFANPLPIDEILERLESIQGFTSYDSRWVPTPDFRRLLEDDLAAGRTEILCPLPGPDIDHQQPPIWRAYSEAQFARRLEAVTLAALDSYQELVETRFKSLTPYLGLGGLLPLRYWIRACMPDSDQEQLEHQAPRSIWTVEALPSEVPNEVRIEVGTLDGVFNEFRSHDADRQRKVAELRPNASWRVFAGSGVNAG